MLTYKNRLLNLVIKILIYKNNHHKNQPKVTSDIPNSRNPKKNNYRINTPPN